MTEISRAKLFGKLNQLGYRTIESATLFCKLRGNPYVELAHWVHQILELQDSDLHHIIRHFQIEPARLAKELTAALDRLPRGASSISDLSVQVEESVERGWTYSSLLFGDTKVRTGHLVVGWLKTTTLRNALFAISREFDKVKIDTLVDGFSSVLASSPENALSVADASSAQPSSSAMDAGGPPAPAALGKQEALARYSVDLTERARSGEMDPILGRDDEIRQIIHVLLRRRQNNPILTGEAGVGKTAVVEGFAQRVANGDVPPQLKDISVRALDLGLLQAGASMKGEFEARLRQVIDEVQASPKPIVLFVDEAHTLIGAGGSQGTGDAANLLKPALARGKLRTIAATTWAEYKKYIENDPALTRRFQVVKIEEPSEEKAVLMLRGTATALESHHRVQLLDEAVEAAVKLSKRYVPDRQLPDKAVSLLDTACARVAITQHALPPELESCQRRIEALDSELEIIARERSAGIEIGNREADAKSSLVEVREQHAKLDARWKSEKAIVDRILALRAELRAASEPKSADAEKASSEPKPELLMELKAKTEELAELQGEEPLILPTVDAQAVATVVSEWTGIPTGRMVKNEISAVLNLSEQLGRRVIGQGHALDIIARRVRTARAGLENPNKPIGVFMLAGPSGVGKTETALALAETLYGGEQNVITLNMSEFQEAHTVSTLKGAPPGYVGYGEGGVLTEAVRRRPYSVVLLDEIEKAHPDVHEVFFQVFDKGFMEDGQGTYIDFKNTIILLTSNVGSDVIMKLASGPNKPDALMLTEALRAPLLQVFPAALLGRMVTIPYYPLSDEMIRNIVRLQLDRVKQRVSERYDVPFTYDESVLDIIASRCTELESGGRAIDAVLTNTLLPQISHELLLRTLEGKTVQRIAVSVSGSEFAYSFE